MIRFLRGSVEIAVTGASMSLCLNRWTAAGLSFWALRPGPDLEFRCRVYESQLARIEREAGRAWCQVRVLRRRGLPMLLERLRARPVLTAGMAAAVALALTLQSFVWFIRVEGNQCLEAGEILHALREEGVAFGAWGPGLDSEYLKNRMLNRVPALRWLAVNRSGGIVTILVAEREPEEPPLDTSGIADLVATRPGIVRELRVTNGFAAVEPGDAVLPGDVLISGVAEWTTHTQMTRAMGEVYADTLRVCRTACPDRFLQKRYTGRTETCVTLILLGKRIKISGNSSIFGTRCDRMIQTGVLRLPEGYALPVAVETVTLREYLPEPEALSPQAAEALLRGEALRQTEALLVAGSVETGAAALQKTQGGYRCRAVWNCVELISRTRPVDPFREDEPHGEDHQRGTD